MFIKGIVYGYVIFTGKCLYVLLTGIRKNNSSSKRPIFESNFMMFLLWSRYTAIYHPLRPSLHSGKRRTIFIILTIWIVCMIPSGWMLIYSKVNILKENYIQRIFTSKKNIKYTGFFKAGCFEDLTIFFRFSTCFTIPGRNQYLED